jgi:hypothetical protein
MFVQLLKDHMGQKAGFRFDTDDAVAQALITSGHAEAIKDDPLAPMIAKSMETMLAGLTTGLSATIDATLKQFANAQTKSNKNAVKAIFGEGGSGDPTNPFSIPAGSVREHLSMRSCLLVMRSRQRLVRLADLCRPTSFTLEAARRAPVPSTRAGSPARPLF